MVAKCGAALVLLAALLAGCGGSGSRPPHFESASGWHVVGEPGQVTSAATVAFAAADRSQSAPIHTVASLPKSGVLIWVQWIRRGKFPTEDGRFPQRSMPLRTRRMAPAEPEGFTCPRSTGNGCAARALQAASSRWDVSVWVFFGTDHPSTAQIAAANAELARLRF